MATARPPSRPTWWGPDWLRLPLAFWVSVVVSAVSTGVAVDLLLRVLDPRLYTPQRLHPGPLATGDYYAAFTCAFGALPALLLWRRALHHRGLHSWDDDL